MGETVHAIGCHWSTMFLFYTQESLRTYLHGSSSSVSKSLALVDMSCQLRFVLAFHSSFWETPGKTLDLVQLGELRWFALRRIQSGSQSQTRGPSGTSSWVRLRRAFQDLKGRWPCVDLTTTSHLQKMGHLWIWKPKPCASFLKNGIFLHVFSWVWCEWRCLARAGQAGVQLSPPKERTSEVKEERRRDEERGAVRWKTPWPRYKDRGQTPGRPEEQEFPERVHIMYIYI